MNLWGFGPDFFPELRRQFSDFLTRPETSNETEFLLPDVIQTAIERRHFRVRVLKEAGRWCGLTFREDLSRVSTIVSSLIERGDYPEELWP